MTELIRKKIYPINYNEMITKPNCDIKSAIYCNSGDIDDFQHDIATCEVEIYNDRIKILNTIRNDIIIMIQNDYNINEESGEKIDLIGNSKKFFNYINKSIDIYKIVKTNKSDFISSNECTNEMNKAREILKKKIIEELDYIKNEYVTSLDNTDDIYTHDYLYDILFNSNKEIIGPLFDSSIDKINIDLVEKGKKQGGKKQKRRRTNKKTKKQKRRTNKK